MYGAHTDGQSLSILVGDVTIPSPDPLLKVERDKKSPANGSNIKYLDVGGDTIGIRVWEAEQVKPQIKLILQELFSSRNNINGGISLSDLTTNGFGLDGETARHLMGLLSYYGWSDRLTREENESRNPRVKFTQVGIAVLMHVTPDVRQKASTHR